MKELTLEQKVGQLMVMGFDGKKVPEEFSLLIQKYSISGVILFARNIGTPKEVAELTASLQRTAKEAGYDQPLLICLDQENGVVRRLGKGSTVFPGSMMLGATHDKENAYNVGYATGKELKALGINWNLAPVLDINNNPSNPVVGVRSFGETPEMVGDFGTEMMKGMQDAGVITTLKHFPGHGDTDVDSHLNLPVIRHSMNRLGNIELKPFIKAIENGADVVMTAHVYFPEIESKENCPATLSEKVITGLLRKRLKFDGVVTTDCMEMRAISDGIGTDAGAVEALKAGVDLVMVSHTLKTQKEVIEKVIGAVCQDLVKESRIDESLDRLRKMKDNCLTWETTALTADPAALEIVGSVEHKELAEAICRKGITVVKNEGSLLPIDEKESSVLVVYPDNGGAMLVEDKRYSGINLETIVKSVDSKAAVRIVSNPPTEKEIDELAEIAGKFDYVIIGTLSVSEGDSQITLVERLHTVNKNIVGIGLRNPYDLSFFPEIPVYISTYEYNDPAVEMAVKVIYGRDSVSGSLPITMPVRLHV